MSAELIGILSVGVALATDAYLVSSTCRGIVVAEARLSLGEEI